MSGVIASNASAMGLPFSCEKCGETNDVRDCDRTFEDCESDEEWNEWEEEPIGLCAKCRADGGRSPITDSPAAEAVENHSSNEAAEKEFSSGNVLPPDLIFFMTLWGEARGESISGKLAVASVILNRAIRRHVTTGMPIMTCFADVCLQPHQFSCWKSLNPPELHSPPDYDSAAWRECEVVARNVMMPGFLPTTSATHYHSFESNPSWAARLDFLGQIGTQLFYLEDSWR